MKKRVALIYGGEGAEREISILSAKALLDLIDKEKYEPIEVYISESGEWYIRDGNENVPTFPILMNGRSGFILRGDILEISAAIPALHGNRGEDGIIQGALEAAHVPFVGEGCAQGAITSDKIYAKAIAEHLGIPTADWIFADGDKDGARERAEEKLGYPLFIKPAELGSSIGAHKVERPEDFDGAYADATAHGGRALIEKLVDIDCEIECAYFNDGIARYSATGSVITQGAFYDFASKYGERSNAKTAAGDRKHPEKRRKIEKYARALAEFLNLKQIARLDFFLSTGGEIYFNEINTFPGMTAASLYPRLTEDMGLRRGEFINRLLDEVAR